MKQITEDYVSYETARLLKEKGFDIPCDSYYTYFESGVTLYKGYFPEFSYHNINHNKFNDRTSRPTQSFALKWLREVHRIETHIVLSELNADNSRKYMFDIYSSDINRDFDSVQKEGFNSYEEAVEAALLYVLKNLI